MTLKKGNKPILRFDSKALFPPVGNDKSFYYDKESKIMYYWDGIGYESLEEKVTWETANW
jgi:hypothetical protein